MSWLHTFVCENVSNILFTIQNYFRFLVDGVSFAAQALSVACPASLDYM